MKFQKLLLFKHFMITKELMLDLNRVVWGASLGFIFFSTLMGAPFAGFVRNLGVGDFLFGVLMALPVMGGLFQVLAAFVLERTGARKKLFLISGFVQRIIVIPMVLLSFIIPQEMKGLLIGLIMVFLLTSSIAGSFNGVTFFSWMAAVVPMNIRGRFFSQRQMVFTFTGLLGGLGVSFSLDRIPGDIGFAVIFVIVSILGVLDIICFLKMYDPPMEKPLIKISLIHVWKEALRHQNFRKYLVFWSLWIFGISLAAPFFADYMLNYLNMNYLKITLFAQVIFGIFTIMSVRFWGNLIDAYGNKPVMTICGLTTVLAPILWCFTTPDNILIVPLIHIILGLFWCGVELSSANMMMGLSPDKNRSFYIANFTMVSALMGSVLGYATGGLLMELTRGLIVELDIIVLGYPMNNYHMLFLFSGLIRVIAIIFFLPAVQEDNAQSSKNVINQTVHILGNKIRGF